MNQNLVEWEKIWFEFLLGESILQQKCDESIQCLSQGFELMTSGSRVFYCNH